MHNEIQFKTEIDCGFNFPSARKSKSDALNHLVVVATLFASVGIAAIVGSQMIWGA